MKKVYQVHKENEGRRLDLFLTLIHGKLSRSKIRTIINDGGVRINDIQCYKPNHKVCVGEVIELSYKQISESHKIIPQDLPIEIIYEDEQILAINKPTGQVVHPATGHWEKTLMNAVSFHRKSTKEIGERQRAGLIHRIDKDTSGIVLIGKTSEALWHFSKQFAERKVEKKYIAVVIGDIQKALGGDGKLIQNYLGRNKKVRKKITEIRPPKGRLAITKFTYIKKCKVGKKQVSVVEASPKTGRTHQIRVHLNRIGYPILGDVIYGRKNKYKRLMLHAWTIKVRNIKGKLLNLEAPLPSSFTEIC